MQQTNDESKFIPLSLERGKARQIQRISLAYTLLKGLSHAHSRRLFLFSNEGQGFKKANSYSHNKARFKNKKVFLPSREQTQLNAQKDALKDKLRRDAIIGLKYGRRFKTLNIGTLQRAKEEGIRIKPSDLILPYSLFKRGIAELISSTMIDKKS